MKRINKWKNYKLQRKHNKTWNKFKNQQNKFGKDRYGTQPWNRKD